MKIARKLHWLILCLLTSITLLGFTASCDKAIDADPMTYVEGTVTDSLSGLPLDSVRVFWQDTLADTITGWPKYTDSAGHFEVDFLGFRQGVFYFLRPGYKTKQVAISGSESQSEFTNLHVSMNKGKASQ